MELKAARESLRLTEAADLILWALIELPASVYGSSWKKTSTALVAGPSSNSTSLR